MSKRVLKKYVSELRKKELEVQLLDLYERFPVVKEYYDFVFNPKEDKLVQDARAKISNEYFPVKRRRPKARRSVAQKIIKHFSTLGVDPHMIADIMLYNLEISQAYEKDRNVPDAFYKSMMNSFTQAVQFISVEGMLHEFKHRLTDIYQSTEKNNWPYGEGFNKALDLLEIV